MVKDQHPQAAKEAARNVLLGWTRSRFFWISTQQDISGDHSDGLEIRIQIFRVRTELPFYFLSPH
jgi:hypothetical protein